MRIPAASWYALGVLTLINLFAYMDRIALTILLQSIKADLHLSDQQLGLLSGLAFALFYATLGIPLAWLADRSSRVRLISFCLATWSLMTTLSGMARNFPQLFFARMGVGIGEAGCLPPAHSVIGDYFPREKRALAISLFNAGAAVGLSGGLFVVGTLAEHHGWRTPLQVIGAVGLPLALLAVLTLREPPRPRLDGDTRESIAQTVGALLRRPAFVHLALAFSIGSIATQGFGQWAPTFLIRSFGMSMGQTGAWIGAISGGGAVIGMLAGGFLASRLIPRDSRWELRLPIIATMIQTPLFVLLLLSPTLSLALTLNALTAISGAFASGIAIAAVQSFAEPHRRATAVSLVMFLMSLLGTGAGPYLVGLISDLLAPRFGQESLRYALLFSSVMLVWATAHFLLANRSASKDRVN
jgi:MFS family permease